MEIKNNFTFEEVRSIIDQFICEECPEYSSKGNGGTYVHKWMGEIHNDHNSSNISKDREMAFETWDNIFEYQKRKDGANYHMLMDWLKKYYNVPELKEE